MMMEHAGHYFAGNYIWIGVGILLIVILGVIIVKIMKK